MLDMVLETTQQEKIGMCCWQANESGDLPMALSTLMMTN